MTGGSPGELDLADDHQLARYLVSEAGRALRHIRRSGALPRRRWGPLVRSVAGDRGAQAVMARILASARPDDPVRSEEVPEDPRRRGARRVWIVDPLDGSAEFGSKDRTDWATQVALWADGDLMAGAIATPATARLYCTRAEPSRSTAPWPGAGWPGAGVPGRALRLAVSRHRPPRWIDAVAGRLSATVVPMGSAGAKTAAVLDGTADAYLHDGGQYEWDSAGPVAVARAAGLHTSRVDGTALRYNQDDPWLPDLLICRPAVAVPLLDTIAEVRPS